MPVFTQDITFYIIFAVIFIFDIPITESAKGVKTVPLRQMIQKARLKNAVYSQRLKILKHKNSTMIDYTHEECSHCRFDKCNEEEGDEENAADSSLFCYVMQTERKRKLGKEPTEHCATGKQLSKLVKQEISELEKTWEGCQNFKNSQLCWCRIEIEDEEEEESPPPEEFDDRPLKKSRLNMVQQRIRDLTSEISSTSKTSQNSIFSSFLLFLFLQIRLLPNL